ncbi:MAG TPA: RDD family protein [Pyrinomonadaceae bacterium]|nr:RDD family protein [Pyrinomonadaceae bacterium]
MKVTEPPAPIATTPKQPAPIIRRSLIEFPGVNRTSVPEWRREVGERVRERHEKRAREAVLEASEVGTILSESNSQTAPALELLPQAEIAPVNPLVAAALRRLERAKTQPAIGAALATAIAYEEPALEIDSIPTVAANPEVARPERIHNLAVVPTPEPQLPEQLPLPPLIATPTKPKKATRVIDELNCSSLNYLDSIPTAVILEARDYQSAPVFLRIFSAIVDLLVIALLSSPVLAIVSLDKIAALDTRSVAIVSGAFFLVGFLYLTISIGFTGRTLGAKLCALRVVDARTGLIPTGSQSAGRSIVFMLSLATAGVAMMYALINRERHTMHDRFTRTAVIRA